MAITRYPPRTVLLGGPDGGHAVIVNDQAAGEDIIPGALVKRSQKSAGVVVFKKHAVAAEVGASKSVALNASMLNRGVDTPYVSGELIEVGILSPGATAWMLLASGAPAIVAGDYLESAGDGTLRKGSAGKLFIALEDTDNSTGALGAPGRIKAEAL
jgi:hypothetical protein